MARRWNRGRTLARTALAVVTAAGLTSAALSPAGASVEMPELPAVPGLPEMPEVPGLDGSSLDPAPPADVPDPFFDIGLVSPGEPPSGDPNAPIRGMMDAHTHITGNVAFGGRLQCGRPFHELGPAVALADCPSHSGFGHGAILETILADSHFPMGNQGYPYFSDWPERNTLLHEQAYYPNIERAWRGGMRVLHNYLVGNRVICELFPALDKTSCNEMDDIRNQVAYLRDMEAYIDGQHGGPGKGWFRIARSPQDIRNIAAEGKLAVTMGVEISELFDCREGAGCTTADVDRGLDEMQRLGISQLYPVHKFDNAFGGTRFDAGLAGAAVNFGNLMSSGHFWQTEPCTERQADNEQPLISGEVHELFGGWAGVPAGTHLPVYPPGPQCNVRGLTPLGAHLVDGMMDRGMIISIDHMSHKTASDTLDRTEARGYAGVASDHSWSNPDIIQRIRNAGGWMASYAHVSHNHSHGHSHDEAGSFISEWRMNVQGPGQEVRGYGFGTDVNGLGDQAAPREDAATNPLRYPFTTPNGAVLDRMRMGHRTYDLNTDGMAQYGLYADWYADLMHMAGPHREQLRNQLMGGAETYTSLWESLR